MPKQPKDKTPRQPSPLLAITDKVLNAVQETQGIKKPDPTKISHETKMSDLGFSDTLILRLTDKLNRIAYEFNTKTKIKTDDVLNCETIQDCVNLTFYAAIAHY
jgi:hypothetical protein